MLVCNYRDALWDYSHWIDTELKWGILVYFNKDGSKIHFGLDYLHICVLTCRFLHKILVCVVKYVYGWDLGALQHHRELTFWLMLLAHKAVLAGCIGSHKFLIFCSPDLYRWCRSYATKFNTHGCGLEKSTTNTNHKLLIKPNAWHSGGFVP